MSLRNLSGQIKLPTLLTLRTSVKNKSFLGSALLFIQENIWPVEKKGRAHLNASGLESGMRAL
jgi:hypothetical protein